MSNRVSDDDRDHATDLVRAAVSDGRLDLQEMDERITAALAARTEEQLDAVVGDLRAHHLAHREPTIIKGKHTQIHRDGPWTVPDQLVLRAEWSHATLDMLDATFNSPACELVLDVRGGTVTVVVPDDVVVLDDGVESYAATLRIRRPGQPEHVRATLRLSGSLQHGHLTAGAPGRFRQWRRRRHRQERKDPPRTR